MHETASGMNNTSILARSTSAMCLFRQWTSCKQTRRMLIYTLNGENTCSVEAVVSSIVTFLSWCRPLTGALNKLLAAQTRVSNAANAECLPKCNKAFVSQKAVLQQITKLPLLVHQVLAHTLLTSLNNPVKWTTSCVWCRLTGMHMQLDSNLTQPP